MSQIHVYVKARMVWSEGGAEERTEVWGVVLALPESARQVSPCLWLAEENGRRFEFHGPLPVVPGN